MIKWYKNKNRKDLNIKDIIKVIYMLPCTWTEDYSNYDEETGLIVANPIKDGDNLIYSVSDALDEYLVVYYKCTADGTILEVGVEQHEEEQIRPLRCGPPMPPALALRRSLYHTFEAVSS